MTTFSVVFGGVGESSSLDAFQEQLLRLTTSDKKLLADEIINNPKFLELVLDKNKIHLALEYIMG